MPLTSHVRTASVVLSLATVLASSGCSILTPEPVWELAKASASVASLAVSQAPSKSSNTIRHFNGSVASLCIRYNPETQVPDMLPALQAELLKHNVESRVYDTTMPAETCGVWLKYMATIDYDMPPFSDQYKAFVSNAQLSLRTAQGQVLSTSQYQLDGGFAAGKWTTTREKISPVITALLSGAETINVQAPPVNRH